MSNTIKLKKYVDVINEYEAGDTIIPGQLVQLVSDGTVQPHGTAGGVAEKAFALEDELQGKGIDDAYAEGDRVQVMYARPGDEVYAFLKEASSITVGEFLESAGDGSLQKYGTATAVETLFPIAVSLDTVATAPANARIKVRIV